MFRENTSHRIQSLFDAVNQMPAIMRNRLEKSWAEVFYSEIFSEIDEHIFEVLYSKEYSRPNTPVNVLVGAELLKAHYGWSDDELFQQCSFNLQVRYALGERDFKGELFSERTVYYFRRALSCYMQAKGINLMEKVFEQLTGEQLKRFAVKTGKQRMDSSFVSSNVRTYTRIQLLVEVVQRFYRELGEEDKKLHGDRFSSYVGKSSGKYCYRLTSDDAPRTLASLGKLMGWILDTSASEWGDTVAFQLVERVFGEHFKITEEEIVAKSPEELSASSLQSPDDWEATFRRKEDEGHHGYVFNVSETCQGGNDLQLITDVSVFPNVTDDTELLEERLPLLAEKTDIDTLYTDGGYASEDNDSLEEEHHVNHIQTAIKGRQPSNEKLQLKDFSITPQAKGGDDSKREVTCPGGVTVAIVSGRKKERWIAVFPLEACSQCAMADRCCTQVRKKGFVLYFTTADERRARRRRSSEQLAKEGKNPRAAIERTMGLFKHRLRHKKLPVRGILRVSQYVLATAMMINFRRIVAYYEQMDYMESSDSVFSFIGIINSVLNTLLALISPHIVV
ncbi:MAG: transposase [Candidatus Cloacimonetes bacterium]|nr:transposase [Bacteroidota bacterium]MBL7086745.1 transposase [Candidatus Cloacimonadota bacterium]